MVIELLPDAIGAVLQLRAESETEQRLLAELLVRLQAGEAFRLDGFSRYETGPAVDAVMVKLR